MYKILKPEGIKIFEQGDGSPWQRLHAIHTFATKHWFGTYADHVHGEMPTAIWLTNDGIECISGEKLTFPELAEVIESNNDFFSQLQKAARERT